MDDLLNRCLTFLRSRQIEAYLVGGVVRDQLLGRDSHDIDLVVPQNGLRVARELANQLGGAFYALDAERETGRIVMPDRAIVDVALIRGTDIDADLAARDFTVNAMARASREMATLIDPHHGADDLQARLVRAVSDQSFADDAVRLIRAVRLADELAFTIEAQTERLMRRDVPLLAQSSGERVRDELVKILQLDDAATALNALQTYQLLPVMLPYARFDQDVRRIVNHLGKVEHALHTGETHLIPPVPADLIRKFRSTLGAYVETALSSERTRSGILKLVLLYQDPKAIGTDLQRLKFSRHEVEYAGALVRHQTRFAQLGTAVDTLATHRFFRDTDSAALGLIITALSRNIGTSYEDSTLDVARALLQNYVEAYDRIIAPKPLLNGAEIAARFGLSGPQIGQALAALVEAQVRGDVNSVADAERYLATAINH
jgi:poly(A) polymerase